MRRERTIEELFGTLSGLQESLRAQQAAVRESKRAIAAMEAAIVRRCAAEQAQRRAGSEAGAETAPRP